ncbi:hypothetical protein, partial [Thermococcus sp.]
LPESVQLAIAHMHSRVDKGFIKLLREADPDKNEKRIMKVLEAKPKHSEDYIYQQLRKKNTNTTQDYSYNSRTSRQGALTSFTVFSHS